MVSAVIERYRRYRAWKARLAARLLLPRFIFMLVSAVYLTAFGLRYHLGRDYWPMLIPVGLVLLYEWRRLSRAVPVSTKED